MVERDKREPIESPEPSGTLKGSLARALAEAAAREPISVELRVSGGIPEQAYRYEFNASGTGQVRASLEDALSGKKGTAGKAELSDEDTRALLETVSDSGVLDLQAEPPRFLPDTVVGMLQISDGKTTRVIYFAADEAQAEAQGRTPPKAVQAVVDRIYRLGARLLDVSSVKP